MAKKIKRKTSLKSSLLLLLLLLILLISSTYAWFTANKNVKVSSLDVNVVAKNGLQISTDAKNWKTIINTTDITNATYDGIAIVNQLPATMEPVSSAKTVTEGKLDLFYGTLGANKETGKFELTATGPEVDVNGQKGKYIAFDLFFKVATKTQLYLSTASNVIPKAEGSKLGLEKAARVALINEGHAVDGNSDLTTYTNLNSGNAGTTFLWEPNANVHKDVAVSNAQSILGAGPELNTSSKLNTFGLSKAIPMAVPAEKTLVADPSGNGITEITPNLQTDDGTEITETALTNLNLEAGITKVRVYMWIEGQDIDCEDTASGSDISFNLAFNIKDSQEII